ncbi:serine/threonine-protein kinase [Singulisphaera rosea]
MTASPKRVNTPEPEDFPSDSESRLAALLQGLIDEFRDGREPDVERTALAHPELAEELLHLWEASRLAEEVARSAWEESPTDDWVSVRAGSRPAAREEVHVPRVGNHVLLDEIGRGGMGVVYRARQGELGRIVALKCLLGGSVSPSSLARFRAEADAVARLSHPHIVPVHDVGEEEGQPFFVMTYIEGTTLARRLADAPPSPLEGARLLTRVCRAVHYAHTQGILHRDLKPSNILIDLEGQPYVSDFGLAKQFDSEAGLTESGAILGTPSYMAPEQASRGRGSVGPASDVYGLGAILYQMLTGKAPFVASSPVETILLVLEQDPVPPRVINPKMPLDLEMIALKCLQKSADQRYPSAAAMADDLDAFLAGERVSARSTSLGSLAARLLGDTHHADVLENWGMLWIYHSIALVVFFGLTNVLLWRGVTSRWPYVSIFTLGLGAWAAVFWTLRRRGGPIRFVERQLAHIWGAGVLGINLIFLVEWLLRLPVLSLSTMFAVTNGMLFMIKGGVLSGCFYPQAALTLLAIFPMAAFPHFAPLIFGLVSAYCFFQTGLKYHLRHRQAERLAR